MQFLPKREFSDERVLYARKLTVHREGWIYDGPDYVEVAAGTELVVTVQKAPTIAGRVLDRQGRPAAGIRVTHEPRFTGSLSVSETDEEGGFRLFAALQRGQNLGRDRAEPAGDIGFSPCASKLSKAPTPRRFDYTVIVAEVLPDASLIDGLRRDAMHARDIAQALTALRDGLEREGIPFAVIGALAMRQHGYIRHTEDIYIVTTSDGLERIHSHLVGRGLLPRAEGLRKRLRDPKHKVDVDVLQAGEHAGAEGSPVRYPDPSSEAFVARGDGIRYATLPALLTFEIASGIWGKRPRDLADAQELIKANGLAEEYAGQLPEALRPRYLELVTASREERDIE